MHAFCVAWARVYDLCVGARVFVLGASIYSRYAHALTADK